MLLQKVYQLCMFPNVQVNLCQKHLFLHQLTHNMTANCSMIYKFNTRKFQKQNMSRTCQEHVIYTNCFECISKRYENLNKVSNSLGIAELDKNLSKVIP